MAWTLLDKNLYFLLHNNNNNLFMLFTLLSLTLCVGTPYLRVIFFSTEKKARRERKEAEAIDLISIIDQLQLHTHVHIT